MPKTLFVTRHAGALAWARRRGLAAEAVDHLDLAVIGAGDVVLGTLPVHLVAGVCAAGARYYHLELDLPPGLRGQELDADAMDRLGAALVPYHVQRLPEPVPGQPGPNPDARGAVAQPGG